MDARRRPLIRRCGDTFPGGEGLGFRRGTRNDKSKRSLTMRAVITRVSSASVEIGGRVTGKIGKGFLVLLGVRVSDTEAEAKKIADRICGLRVFEDEGGKMNVSPMDAGAELLIISQFTLYAEAKSRRPGFTLAARPDLAVPLYELVVAECRARGFKVETGEFGAEMRVASVNDGPVTIILDTMEGPLC